MADQTLLPQYMALVLLVGAANADADPTQRALLRERVLPPLRDESLTGVQARRKACEELLDIMGDQWAPGPEWLRYIESILEGGST